MGKNAIGKNMSHVYHTTAFFFHFFIYYYGVVSFTRPLVWNKPKNQYNI